MENSASDWPALDEYVAGQDILGFEFSYPPEYLACIRWGDQDFDAGGDGHALAFLGKKEIARDMKSFVHATRKCLVPFARGGNGDGLYCFDGIGGKEIYVINLGEKPLRARSTGYADFLAFIDYYRASEGLPKWTRDLTAKPDA
jgi:hypothetical protein